MLSIKNILLPSDGSECSLNAFKYILPFVKILDAKLHLLTVISEDHSFYNIYSDHKSPDQVRKRVNLVISKSLSFLISECERANIKIKKEVRYGIPHEEIIKYSKENDIDLIVIGTNSRRGFSKLLYGSVTERVIQNSSCPVLVITPKFDFTKIKPLALELVKSST